MKKTDSPLFLICILHISLGKIIFISDFIIILIGGILLRDIDGIIYGLIVTKDGPGILFHHS